MVFKLKWKSRFSRIHPKEFYNITTGFKNKNKSLFTRSCIRLFLCKGQRQKRNEDDKLHFLETKHVKTNYVSVKIIEYFSNYITMNSFFTQPMILSTWIKYYYMNQYWLILYDIVKTQPLLVYSLPGTLYQANNLCRSIKDPFLHHHFMHFNNLKAWSFLISKCLKRAIRCVEKILLRWTFTVETRY